jgi:uncharacterized protein
MHDVTTDASVLLDRYVAAWNEADPERRRAAVGRLYADHGCIVTPSVAVRGRQEILEHIGRAFAEFIGTSELRFRRTASTGHHRSLLLRWELTAGGLPVAGSGLNVLLLGPDDRIEADHQFSEPEPARESQAAGR